ncbi:MAG: bifunctional ADP-dependent NAD(P)H-hydrate dehydratase/NAD(P)H-hydrate epimerase [Actinobacteria bacterium]|nr:bifunctional ADP-dependent NAD(P)H-hydrate dehydratase/NAD(P)H-hydrate epimerase [Actinomycetota bacterium]
MIRAYGADSIRAAEAPLLAAGVPLMRQAARAVATATVREIRDRGQRVPGSVVLALVGGGNNGGDALWAAADLARRGVAAHAALCARTVHAEGLAAARSAGVRIVRVVPEDGGEPDLAALLDVSRRSGAWIDGLAGIGLSGPLRDPLARIVAALEEERRASPDEPVVIAVDVPSGVVGSGAAPGDVLRAHLTVTMGAAKPALLLPPACAAAGRVEVLDLGLPLDPATVAVRRLGAADVADLFPWPRREDHKYTRGVVGVWAGSAAYQGAAVLASAGALAAGPGMVRYLGPVASVRDHHPEVVTAPGRIQAALVGSGIAGPEAALHALQEAAGHDVPLVADAGVLEVLDDVAHSLAAPAIVTPHAGELAALLGATREDVEADPASAALRYAADRGLTVLLKGHVTVVATPDGELYGQDGQTSWLASAGSGDVLAGLLAALVAMLQARAEPRGLGHGELAAAGAAASWLHSRAGVRAAHGRADRPGSGGPLTASSVARHLPAVIAALPR